MSIPIDAMLDELADRERLQGDLFAFAWEVALRNVQDKVPALHHLVLCKRLERLQSTPVGEMDDLYVGMPPRSAKTAYGSLAFPSWAMGRNPRLRVIMGSSTTERAEMLTGKIRDLLADREYQRVFPDTMLDQSSLARGQWATTAGGTMWGAGVGKTVQGLPADLLIVDDPYGSVDDAFSDVQRATVTSWFFSTLATRCEPTAKKLLICQRMHRYDLAGEMMDRFQKNENPEKRVLDTLILAAECDDPENDPLGRQMGELLWPTHHDSRYLAQYREDPYLWLTLYMQQPPTTVGGWAGSIQYAPNPPFTSALSLYMVSDVADSHGKGDATVHLVIGHDRRENLFYVMDAWRDQTDVATGAAEFIKLYLKYKPFVACLIDSDIFSKAMKIHVDTMGRQQNLTPWFKIVPHGGKSKGERAGALRGMFARGLWRFDETKWWTERIKKELDVFPYGKGVAVDDCVDAMALIGRHLDKTMTEAPPPEPVKMRTIQEMQLEPMFEDNEGSLNGYNRRI